MGCRKTWAWEEGIAISAIENGWHPKCNRIIDGFLGCMCAWSCSKGAGLPSIPNHVPLSLAFYMRWKDSRIFKVLEITLETSSMFMTIF